MLQLPVAHSVCSVGKERREQEKNPTRHRHDTSDIALEARTFVSIHEKKATILCFLPVHC